MAYDGKIMHRAILRFEEDRQAREARFLARREDIFHRQPRLRQIDNQLRSTMSRIIAGALRRGTDPLPAVERLREENLGLQTERRQLLGQMGLAETALEEVPECPLCGDTGVLPGPGVPVPGAVLYPGAAKGAQPDAGPGQPEL